MYICVYVSTKVKGWIYFLSVWIYQYKTDRKKCQPRARSANISLQRFSTALHIYFLLLLSISFSLYIHCSFFIHFPTIFTYRLFLTALWNFVKFINFLNSKLYLEKYILIYFKYTYCLFFSYCVVWILVLNLKQICELFNKFQCFCCGFSV